MFITQNLLKNTRNFIFRFFPHSVRPFYRTVRTERGLARDSRCDLFMALIYIACFIYKLRLGHDGAGTKNPKNHIYVCSKSIAPNVTQIQYSTPYHTLIKYRLCMPVSCIFSAALGAVSAVGTV